MTYRYRTRFTFVLLVDPADLTAVFDRAKEAGVNQLILTGGSLSESEIALEQAQSQGILSCLEVYRMRASADLVRLVYERSSLDSRLPSDSRQ